MKPTRLALPLAFALALVPFAAAQEKQPPESAPPKSAPQQQQAPQPASKPKPPAPQTQPASNPAAAPKESDNDFPTPAQLFERMKKARAQKAALTKVAYFDMAAMPVLEKPLAFSLFADTTPYTLRAWVQRLHAARDDKDVRGVLMNLGAASGLNLAQAQEVRDALVSLRQAGKKTFVYADSYDTVAYTVASGATNVCLLEGGEIMIPGIGLEATFAKGLLDKVGVRADYVQVGEYKGADEQYTRTAASDELRGELNKLTESMYEGLVGEIAHHRNLSREVVKQLIDDTIVSAKAAKERGFVDHLVHQDQLRKLLADELGNEVDLLANYGQAPAADAEAQSPLALLSNMFAPSAPGRRRRRRGRSRRWRHDLRRGRDRRRRGGRRAVRRVGRRLGRHARSLRQAARDPNVKAIVIRIDSPGGSALASEVMWQAARKRGEKAGGRQHRQHGGQRRVLPRRSGRPHLRRPVGDHRVDRRGRREVRLEGPVRQARHRHRILPARAATPTCSARTSRSTTASGGSSRTG